MKYHDPLKQILWQMRPYWDQDATRLAVRWAFLKALQCRTLELGAEVYGSDKEERAFCHTCKSRGCSSCGYRVTAQWQRGWWTALPEALYKGITFTMPKELWPLFRNNPLLAKALPVLAAKVIQTWARTRDGLRVGVHCRFTHLQREARVQLACTHNGHWGRAVHLVRFLGLSRLLPE